MVKLDLDLWLTAEDIGPEAEVTFIDEGEIVSKEETGFSEDSFNITIRLPSGEKRVWTMNKTSQRTVARLYGYDTANWVNKKVTLVTRKVMVGGKEKSAIFVKTEK